MEPAAVVTGVFGLLVTATRAPLVFAPRWTRERFLQILAAPGAVRGLGLLAAGLGVGLVLFAPGVELEHPVAAVGLRGLGAWLLAVSAWTLVFPAGYRSTASGLLAAVGDPAALRVLGILGTAVGLALLWLAWQIR